MSTTAKSDDPYKIGSVDSALRLLLMLADSDEVKLAEAARQLGVARSTAHRIMRMLVSYGFAEQNGVTRGYQVGPSWQVVAVKSIEAGLARAAFPALSALARDTGETAQLLALRPSGHTVSILAVEGGSYVRATAQVGQQFPAHLTAGGRILLGRMPQPARSQHLMRSIALAEEGAPTAALLDAVERSAERGFSIQHDEYEVGTSAVAVPVVISARVVYSLDIVMPTSRLERTSEESLVERARVAAHDIVAAMG
jgi:DNA-binding IclR family transcriptional regulator